MTAEVTPPDDDAIGDVTPVSADEDASGEVIPRIEVAFADDDAANEVASAEEVAAGNVAPTPEDAKKDVLTADGGVNDDDVPVIVSAARIVVTSAGPDAIVDSDTCTAGRSNDETRRLAVKTAFVGIAVCEA